MLPTIFKNVGRDCLLITRDSNLIFSPFNYQSVRWRRKPRWLPVAKSKMFRIPERPKIPEEDYEELKRLHNNYRTEMKSLRIFFAEKTRSLVTGIEVIAEQLKFEEEEHHRCLKINDEWNANVASMRLARLAIEKELELENIIKEVEEYKKKDQERKEQMEILVRQEKERSKTFITPLNIDEAIEKALSSVVDHDYAIDLEGNMFVGRLTKPKPIEKPKRSTSSEEVLM